MKFPRIHADEQGETHIGVLDVPEHEAVTDLFLPLSPRA